MNCAFEAWLERNRGRVLLAVLVCVYGTALVWTESLTQPIRADEEHFWATTHDYFLEPLPPSAETLRSYPELITPLSYILWGQLERWTGSGVVAGRVLNLVLSVLVLVLLAGSLRDPPAAGLGAVLGLLLYPYFLALGVHFYTDMIGAFLLVLGLHQHLRGKLASSCVLFVLAIATRQYLVQVPAAIALWEGLRWLRGEESAHWSKGLAPGLACASIFGWIAFWGGLAPQPGIDRWVPLYPAPMMSPFHFVLHYGLYFLATLGAYFAVVEAAVFRSLPSRRELAQPWVALVALGLVVLFALAPPLLQDGHRGGAFGRVTQTLLDGSIGNPLRMLFYYALALFAVVRLGLAGGLPLLITLLGVVLAMKSQIPWEKYLFPCLLPLWYLRSRPDRPGGLAALGEPRSG